MVILDNVYVILLLPKRSGNVGSVARAMKNFGLKNLRVVSRHNPLKTFQAKKMAVHAYNVIQNAKLYTDLQEALCDLHIVVGTSGKFHVDAPAKLSLNDLEKTLSLSPKNKIGFLFGPEDRGLSGEELSFCNYSLTIPTSKAYSSLNLSHAAAVVAYEIFRESTKKNMEIPRRLASREAMERMYERMQDIYGKIGFLEKINPQRIMKVIRAVYDRSSLNDREVNILMGILRQTDWFNEEEKKKKK